VKLGGWGSRASGMRGSSLAALPFPAQGDAMGCPTNCEVVFIFFKTNLLKTLS